MFHFESKLYGVVYSLYFKSKPLSVKNINKFDELTNLVGLLMKYQLIQVLLNCNSYLGECFYQRYMLDFLFSTFSSNVCVDACPATP